MTEDHFKEHVKTWYQQAAASAAKICKDADHNFAWVFEEEFAKAIIENCACIVEDCNDLRIPLSEVADYIRNLRILS